VVLVLHPEVFTTICRGTSLHYVNRCVEVEQSETSFDYRSLMYTIKKCETTHDDDNGSQGTMVQSNKCE
jgi:hypothetical protein